MVPPEGYLWREWAGQAVVFVHATGDTHALSHEATTLLEAMRAQAGEGLAAAAWFERAGLAQADDSDAEAVMEGLAAIGLVGQLRP